MTGSSVFDYIHQQDHAELAEQLGINLSQSQTTHGMAASPGSVASDDGSSSSAPGGTSTPTGLDRPGMQRQIAYNQSVLLFYTT